MLKVTLKIGQVKYLHKCALLSSHLIKWWPSS